MVVVKVISITLLRIFLNFLVSSQVHLEDKIAVKSLAAGLAGEHLLGLPHHHLFPLLRSCRLGTTRSGCRAFSLLFPLQLEDALPLRSGLSLLFWAGTAALPTSTTPPRASLSWKPTL